MFRTKIYESTEVCLYLQKRLLLQSYRLAKQKIETGIVWWTFFKKRKSILDNSEKQVYYFSNK